MWRVFFKANSADSGTDVVGVNANTGDLDVKLAVGIGPTADFFSFFSVNLAVGIGPMADFFFVFSAKRLAASVAVASSCVAVDRPTASLAASVAGVAVDRLPAVSNVLVVSCVAVGIPTAVFFFFFVLIESGLTVGCCARDGSAAVIRLAAVSSR